jgi:HSP20 family protein
MYRSLFSHDLFSDLQRLQRELQQAFDPAASIRGFGRGGFPALNVGSTPEAVEIYAYAPGLDPNRLEVNLERGVLTLSGEREASLPGGDDKAAVHINERFAGCFRRATSLPDDIDPDSVTANYRDGVLHITVKRRQASQPRRITVQ